jgi:subtilase family serine protease
MKSRSRLLRFVLLFVLAFPIGLFSQSRPERLVAVPVDDRSRVILHGSVHPLAQARYDQGAVPDSLPAQRILLLLNRPPAREVALQQFLSDVHSRVSASYHKWITAEQFGERFGPVDSDIQAAVNWLQSQGFTIARVAKSKQFVEFSGTTGQLRNAFHTEIHQYNIDGEKHYANANDLSIPSALAELVRGVSPLSNFHAKPYVAVAGRARYSPKTKQALPDWTIPNPFGTSNPYAYPVAPEDFATQYDLNSLYQAGINGTGETIGIINESNIDLSLVSAYQQMFGLASNPTQVVIDGDDPGTLNGVDVEAYLDVEVSGAVAPGATVNLYISNGSDFQDPLALAAIRAVEDNQASVLSVSFGTCEFELGNAGNQFWSGLWEQAAAQGQTVFVASGDSGPYCNYAFFGAINGIASTPWDVAVGGTDFYYSDYATGGASAATLWNQANDGSLGSLKAPLPEQVWNDPFGFDVISDGLQRGEVYAGGSGASSCITLSLAPACTGGYAKPNWQTGLGVPADGVRDIPDVSLFASNGANLSAYPICAFAGECVPDANNQSEVLFTGGTSASSPAMAAIMALVDQKYGRQGQANFVLYPLAQQQPSVFHDITLGSNDSPCQPSSTMTECALNANGSYATTIYSAGPGYDLASGLGSVDANALVNAWNTVSLLPTTTALSLSAREVKHGTPVTITTSVSPTSGSGTPTGDVAVLTTSALPSNQGQTFVSLNGGKGTQTIDFFPGGTYWVTGQYGGDPTFESSTSQQVALTVTPENANINFAVLNGNAPISSGGSVQYNSPLALTVQPVGASASGGKTNGNATGTATFTVDSTTATVALNSVGVASWTPPALSIGNHTATATYSGDASFNASSSKTVSFSVAKGQPWVNLALNAPEGLDSYNINPGGSLTMTATVGPFYGNAATSSVAPLGTAAPTGTVEFCLQPPNAADACLNPTYTQTVNLNPTSGTNSQYATATATFTNLGSGFYLPTFVYSGDANWQNGGELLFAYINVAPVTPLATSSTTLTITPASVSPGAAATFTTTVTGSSNTGPTGEIDYYDNGVFLTYALLSAQNPSPTVTFSFPINSASFWNDGTNQITAIYDGDSNYQPSFSNAVNLAVVQGGGNFLLAPQQPQVLVKPGSSASAGVNLSALNNFNGNVALTCTPSSSQITCSVNPSFLTLNGAANVTLTVNAAMQSGALHSPKGVIRGLGLGSSFIVVSIVLGGFQHRKRRMLSILTLGLFAALVVSVGCGSGSSNQQQQRQPPPNPSNSSTYNVIVSATANGVVHNAKVLVLVQQ